MKTWIEHVALWSAIVVLVVVMIGMYSTWRKCEAAGGTTVRGLFGLECICSRVGKLVNPRLILISIESENDQAKQPSTAERQGRQFYPA